MQDTIGIDISKDTLDAHRQSDGRHARFGNDRAGLTALRRWIGKAPVRIAVEAAAPFGWERFIGENGAFVGMHGWGASAPADRLYKEFGITAEAVVKRVRAML